MLRLRDEDFTFVTNNAIDFRRLFRKEQIHSGLVIIVLTYLRESSVRYLEPCWTTSAIAIS